MQFKSKNLGDHRWLLWAYSSDHNELVEFMTWCEAYKDRFWARRDSYLRSVEIRGTSHRDASYIVLKWSK